MKDWIRLWFKKRWTEVDFRRFHRIFTLQTTSRSFHLKKSESFDHCGKLRPFFDHLFKHFQDVFLPESYQSIDEHMFKFKGKSLMRQYMKNEPIKWGFKFWFRCGSKSEYLYDFDTYLGKTSKTEFGLCESVVLSLCENLKTVIVTCFLTTFLQVQISC